MAGTGASALDVKEGRLATAPYKPSEIREHLIRSNVVADTFRIKVFLPIRRADESERFGVVYATDSDDYFGGLATLASTLQLHGETPRFVLVGIGYENAQAAAFLRQRDFWPHSIRALYRSTTEQVAKSPLGVAAPDLRVLNETTDASHFLRFICEELMPFIDRSYATQSGENTYSGYSAGGGFGLHALFTRPESFRRYLLGSPATSYRGRHFGIELASRFLTSGGSLDAKVFLSVGELEEFKRGFGQFDLVTGYYLLAKYLKERSPQGLDITARVFPGETHATAWALAFSHGLKSLLGPADCVPFWPEYLKT